MAGDTGLARESGPETTELASRRREVLGALSETIEAALDAGAANLRGQDRGPAREPADLNTEPGRMLRFMRSHPEPERLNW